jgi:hypothetical protein
MRILRKWEGHDYGEIKVPKADTVKNLASMFNTCSVGEEQREIDASKLFHRLVIAAYSQRLMKLSDVFSFELTVYPTSLFKTGILRKPDKPALLRDYCKDLVPALLPHGCVFVVDGGCLLHKVRWVKATTFHDVVASYAAFVLKHFGGTARVVFDGYGSAPTTKDHEHSRRATKKASVAPNIQIQSSTMVTLDQDIFLTNTYNKQQFIDLLAQHLRDLKLQIKQSTGDADTDIVAVAIDIARQRTPVVVYAEDTDILALLLYHWQPSMAPIFIKSDGKARTPGKCIDISRLQNHIGPAACQQILVFHAFGGCDTTSAIFRHGKGKLFKQLSQNKQMNEHVNVLQNPISTMDSVCNAGLAFMIAVYGGKVSDKLGDMRYAAYSKMIAVAGGSFVADRLPPTEDAANLHAMRVHLQAVVWGTLGTTALLPTDWGWRLQSGFLHPIPMIQKPGPPELMKVIYCNCKSDKACSSQLCTCRKNNLKCIAACGHCHGSDCANAEILVADHHDSDSESDCGEGTTDLLPDMMLTAEFDYADEEEVTAFGSDFMFDPNLNVDDNYHMADEEVVDCS